jgi:hypothetical protein
MPPLMARMALRSIPALLASLLVLAPLLAAAAPAAIEISPARVRAQPGDRVEFRVNSRDVATRAVVVTPGTGARPVTVERLPSGEHRVVVTLATDAAAGLYLLQVWTGDEGRPTALGKAALLAGPIVLDFFLPAYLDAADPRADLAAYLDDFRSLGGNTLIAHALITPDRAFFPSAIARTVNDSRSDAVADVLSEADRRGLAVFLSVSWDMTHPAPYSDRMRQITALMGEMFERYAHHPSLAGFYSYQEGSGTYYVPYVREFAGRVKALNPGLLSACAPFVDDPLLAGYLSTVDALDMMIFQAQVMASYRTDNRKKYPLRRVRDFSALSVGAKWLQDKIAVTHVEVFGYLENRPDPKVIAASYEHIFGQIASVATTPGADGLALFAYHSHIWSARANPKVQRSRQAVADGVTAFLRIQRATGSYRNPLAVYFPYSDWIVERWTTSILPGLDGFRRAGIPIDIVPYAPRPDESEYPYFPFHHNPAVLERLLLNRRVLVLPDVSGFQQTDSDLIAPFVERGGVLVAFGPQIPMGRTFERDALFGAREATGTTGRTIRVPRAFGRRVADGGTCTVAAAAAAWRADAARVLATYEDGSPAIVANASGRGLAIAALPSVQDLAAGCPDLLRDVLELAQKHVGTPVLADIVGLAEASDVAIAPAPDGISVAIVNHEASARSIRLRAIDSSGTWIDAVSGQSLPAATNGELSLDLPAAGVRIVRLKKRTGGP